MEVLDLQIQESGGWSCDTWFRAYRAKEPSCVGRFNDRGAVFLGATNRMLTRDRRALSRVGPGQLRSADRLKSAARYCEIEMPGL